MSLAAHFSRFLGADPDRLHAAAHSHHPWPDVTAAAQQQAWEDAAAAQDAKWSLVFGEVLPEARRHVARLLGLPDPGTVVFAPTTHELVLRILSCLPSPTRVLTTGSEFHSFTRQSARLEEAGLATVDRVPAEPFASFPARLAAAAAQGRHHLVYCSQVLFDSAYALPDLQAVVAAVPDDDTFVVIDGYHAFMALPVDLGPVASRVFFLAGGYKYAMAGEGACFAHCPPGYGPRPVNTGWFAQFARLAESAGGEVAYPEDAQRFAGATFDPTGVYRFNAVQRWLAEVGWDAARIHAHVLALQARFCDTLDRAGVPGLSRQQLVPSWGTRPRGNFLVFRSRDAEHWCRRLAARKVVTDRRGDRWRLGFGCYHDEAAVDELVSRIRAAADGG